MVRKTLFNLLSIAGLALGILLAGLPGRINAQEPDENTDSPGAVGTALTYEGRLADEDGKPLAGIYDFEFKVYDALTGGNQMGQVVTKDNVAVSDGLFTVQLDLATASSPATCATWKSGCDPAKGLTLTPPSKCASDCLWRLMPWLCLISGSSQTRPVLT